ncbi:hypothetical protein ACFQ51_47595 [Streptomyces kaempferi]
MLTNGGESTSSFGGALRLDVDVTMTTRERSARRALTPGAPGRDAPEAEHIASSADTEALAPRSRMYACSPRPRSPWTPRRRTG